MKKNVRLVVGFLFGALLILSSCEELLGDLTKFDSNYKYVEFKIYPQDKIGEHVVFLTKTQESDLTEELQDNGFDESNIDEVKLKEATFEVINADTDVNFNGIASFGASFIDAGNQETVIAELNPVPEDSREVTLSPNSDDLAAFLKETEYTIQTYGIIDEVITDTIEVRAKIKYEIKAKL